MCLKGYGSDSLSLNTLVESLSELPELRKLVMIGVDDELTKENFEKLVSSFHQLETLETSGGQAGVDILPSLSKLKHLKRLTFIRKNLESFEQVLRFVSNLDPEAQKGFFLSLITRSAQTADDIQEAIWTRAEGRFELTPWPDVDDDEDTIEMTWGF